MLIPLDDLNPRGFELTEEQERNLPVLHGRVNQLVDRFLADEGGTRPVITSGVRTVSDHRRVYAEKARKLGLKTIKVPMGSMHLRGAAVDINDPGGQLYRWLKKNPDVLVELELWCEDEKNEARVHVQIYPPVSGKRWFKP